MSISLQGIVVIVGNYGSGKTEVSINLAVQRQRDGMAVRLADLDLVNPYFRTREARTQLARLGIEVILPPARYLQADLPVLSPAVGGLIRKPFPLTILDVGGDEVGATVLAALADAFKNQSVRMLQVINPYRPNTDTLDGCRKLMRDISHRAGMPINGIIGNANLIDDTTVQNIYEGYQFCSEVARNCGLPLEFVTTPSTLQTELDYSRIGCPVLPIARQLVPPWKKPTKLGGSAQP